MWAAILGCQCELWIWTDLEQDLELIWVSD